MKRRYKHKFDRIVTHCDWFKKPWQKIQPELILGVSRRYFSPTEYEYQFGFFGLMVRIWMKRELIESKTPKQ